MNPRHKPCSDRKDKPRSFLFVCYGNICRSPMAEAIVRHLLGDRACSESAGIAALGNGAMPEAVEAVQTLFNIDISGHRSRHVSEVDTSVFDYVIAMDGMIYEWLKAAALVSEEKLFEWDINDPVGQPLSVFKRTAVEIQKKIEQFLLNRDVH